jgi:hypothetical protein
MPGFTFHFGATAACPHQTGRVMVAPNQKSVAVRGQLVATTASTLTVVGCTFTVPGPKPQPCVTVKWLMPSTRVFVNGNPVLLQPSLGASPAICQSAEQIPQGPPQVSTMMQVALAGG